jgi:hypothetical protein
MAELQIVSRCTISFPQDHRFSLGARLEDGLYSLLEGVIEAKFTHQKSAILRRCDW